MPTFSVPHACKQLDELIATVQGDSEPITLTSERGNAVLLSEQAWHSLRETLHIVSIPEVHESIREGIATPSADLDGDLDW